jgi:hypothetical protein
MASTVGGMARPTQRSKEELLAVRQNRDAIKQRGPDPVGATATPASITIQTLYVAYEQTAAIAQTFIVLREIGRDWSL